LVDATPLDVVSWNDLPLAREECSTMRRGLPALIQKALGWVILVFTAGEY
jgi:hypothetical protein